MARLISPPLGLGVIALEPLSGPRTVGMGKSGTISDFVQTVSSPMGLWRLRLSFQPIRGAKFRAYRGWITALHGGANATRWKLFDPDRPTHQEAGVNAAPEQVKAGQPWSNGQPWSSGQNWETSHPHVPLAADIAKGGSLIRLADEFWGHGLKGGEWLGFAPFYFGAHMVTQVIAPGTYRIWPPLRKAFTTGEWATFDPVLAMRLESEEAATAGRTLVSAASLAVTLVEVPDYTVRKYFAD